MSLEQKIMDALKVAMIAKDEKTVRSLRAVKAAIILAKTNEGAGGSVTPEEEIRLLQKLVKQRKDSLEIFRQQKREDLAVKEEEEINVIQQFLPAALSPDELKQAVQKIITDAGATSPADMGKVMGLASKALSGKADGREISAVVKELLAAK